MTRKLPTYLALITFAVAMAWVESAVVVYLRTLIDRIEPYQPNPLPWSHAALGQAEFVREAATLIMLWTVGWLAGRNSRTRWAYTSIAFGVWDIFYYVFLKMIVGWPRTLFDWDILFLLPMPWWGPVLAPALISLVMIAGGALIVAFDQDDRPLWPSPSAWMVSLVGALFALYVFMADAIRAASGGVEAIRNVLPATFNWPLFLVGLALMTVPLGELLWRTQGLSRSTEANNSSNPAPGTA